MSAPIGNFDAADPRYGLRGWALDPDTPNVSIAIHFYGNAEAGTPGSVFLGSTIANLPRPDVNAATGYSGNHGFNWILPTENLTPCRPNIYAYAIDSSGNNNNPRLAGTPVILPLREETITSAGPLPFPITIKISSRWGAAIYSLKYRGLEFIDAIDHGRLLQSAAQFYDYPNSWNAECYNPTEAGSEADDQSECSHTQILKMYSSGNTLETRCKMAFYSVPYIGSAGCTVPQHIVARSEHIHEKKVTIGLNNSNVSHSENVIQYEVTQTIPTNETHLGKAVFEFIACYINAGNFTKVWHYDQATQNYYQITPQFDYLSSAKPVIITTTDTNWAIGIYSQIVHPNAPYGYGYAGSGNYIKLGMTQEYLNISAGSQFSFKAYLIVGTLAEVVQTIKDMIVEYPNI